MKKISTVLFILITVLAFASCASGGKFKWGEEDLYMYDKNGGILDSITGDEFESGGYKFNDNNAMITKNDEEGAHTFKGDRISDRPIDVYKKYKDEWKYFSLLDMETYTAVASSTSMSEDEVKQCIEDTKAPNKVFFMFMYLDNDFNLCDKEGARYSICYNIEGGALSYITVVDNDIELMP